MKIAITPEAFDAACKVRASGFRDAAMSVATQDSGKLVFDSEDWSALTMQFRKPRPFGLGDAVAAVAHPIAGAIDAVLGTNVKGCAGCAQRREALNRVVTLRR